ncbi:MAG TPA: hypothetical protein PKW95_17380 [bacterium]|nr:hypothetical protein [bacterium]
MNYAILYNVFCCWVVAVIGLSTVRELRKEPQPTPTWLAYAWFWLLASGLWFLAGLRLLAFFSGLLWLDRLLFYFDEVFAGFHLVAGTAFLARHVWGESSWTRGLIWFAGIFVVVFLGLLFWLGIQETICTPWASEHELPRPAFLVFVVPYLLCLFLVFYATIRDVVARKRRGEWVDFGLTLATWSLLVYSLAGLADVRGVWAGWQLLMIRLIYMIAAFTAFWVAQTDRSHIRLIRPSRGD